MEELETVVIPWNQETFYALGLYKLIGRGLGIWPLKCHDFGSKFRFLTVMFLQLLLNYSLIHEIVSDCGVFVIDTMSYIAGNTVGLLKIVAMRVHEKKMHFIVQSAVEDWHNVRDDKSHEIMRRHARIGRYVGILQLGGVYATVLPTIIGTPPTFRQSAINTLEATNFSSFAMRNLPMSTGCFVNDMPIFLYLFFYLLELIQYVVLSSTNVGSDAIFFGVAMHLCAQIEILKNHVEGLGRDPDEKNTREEFKGLIRRHNHLARLADIIEDVFHLVILGQLTGSALNICQMGFEMLLGLKNDDYMALIHSLIIIAVLCLQLFLYSYVGDYLGSQMEGLQNATYNCYWYNFSPSLKKNVIIVMMRGKDSFSLTAGKVYRMNIKNFTSIVKTIVSFFSVVKLTVME